MDKIKYWDEQLFLYLNHHHQDWLDPFVATLTGKLIWLPLYAFFLFLILKYFKKSSIWILAGIGLAILMADQTASGLMKPFFERLRPCHEPALEGLMYNHGGCGGMYGFVSSHAANTFALAAYMNLAFHKRIKGLGWIYLWAALISYTRVYLGVHYPLDIIVGALIGMLSGWVAWLMVNRAKIIYLRKVEAR